MNIQFPHINRKLTAPFLAVVFSLISVINLARNQKDIRFMIMQNPSAGYLHEKFGQLFLGTDDMKAEREYTLAQENYDKNLTFEETDVLGSQSSPEQTWLNLAGKRKNLKSEIKYWEKVLLIYPDYNYAFLNLAVLNAMEGNSLGAKKYLTILLANDPGNKDALNLKNILK